MCLKRLLSIEQLDDNLKNSGKVELAKLRKAQADYKAKVKQMQQKMANKLFNANNATKEKKEVVKEDNHEPNVVEADPAVVEEKTSVPAPQQEEVKEVQQSDANVDGTTKTAPKPAAKTASTEAVAAAKGVGNNMMMLVATSLIVVVFSLVIAYIYR